MRTCQHLNAFLKGRRAAGLSEYAIILGLISMIAIGAVAATGDRVKELFDTTHDRVEEVPGAGPRPTASLTVSRSLIDFAESATFTWETTEAASINATYQLSGECQALAGGSGPFALSWTGSSGSADLSWSEALGGCAYDVSLRAVNIHGKTTATATVSIDVADTTPETLDFQPVFDADPNATVVSNEVEVTGIEGKTTITVSNDEAGIAVEDGEFSKTQEVLPNQTVKLRTTAPAGFSEPDSVHFTAGGLSGSWNVATRDEDTDPAQFNFVAVAPQAPANETATTTAAPLADFDGSLTVFTTNGALISTDGLFWHDSSELQISAGQTLHLKLTSSGIADGSGQASTTVSIGGTNATWTVSTRDMAPDAFAFTTPAPVAPGAVNQIVTLSAPISGLTSGVDLVVTLTQPATGNATVSKDGANWLGSGQLSVTNGDVLRVRFSAASAIVNGTGFVSSTVTLGGPSAVARLDTQDLTIAALSFPTSTVAPGSVNQVVTQQQVVSGLSAGASVPVTFGAVTTVPAGQGITAAVSKDGANWFGSGALNVANNDQIRVRFSSASASNDGSGLVSVSVSAGGASAVATIDSQDTVPTLSPSDFNNQTGVARSSNRISSEIVLANFEGTITASCSGGCTGILRNGANQGTTGVAFSPNDRISLAMTASAAYSTPKTVTVTIAGIAVDWTVSTEAAPANCTSSVNITWTGSGLGTSCSAMSGTGNNGATKRITGGTGWADIECDDGTWIKTATSCPKENNDK